MDILLKWLPKFSWYLNLCASTTRRFYLLWLWSFQFTWWLSIKRPQWERGLWSRSWLFRSSRWRRLQGFIEGYGDSPCSSYGRASVISWWKQRYHGHSGSPGECSGSPVTQPAQVSATQRVVVGLADRKEGFPLVRKGGTLRHVIPTAGQAAGPQGVVAVEEADLAQEEAEADTKNQTLDRNPCSKKQTKKWNFFCHSKRKKKKHVFPFSISG